MNQPIETARSSPDSVPCATANGRQSYRLSRDEVGLLAARIAVGDCEARNILVQANLGLVVRVARGYVGRGLMMDDLVGEGNLGLIRAAEVFDPRIGTHFSTYATYWIRESISSALMNTTATIRLPAHVFRLMIKWSRTEHSLRRLYGRSPTTDEITEAMGLNDHQKDLLVKARHARGIRLESGLSFGPQLWMDANMMDCHDSPDATVEADEERNFLFERLSRLSNQERTVLILRYGLCGEASLNYNEIARRLGVNRETVRKTAKLAIKKLMEGPSPDLECTKSRQGGGACHGKKSPRSRSKTAVSSIGFEATMTRGCTRSDSHGSPGGWADGCPEGGSAPVQICSLPRCG